LAGLHAFAPGQSPASADTGKSFAVPEIDIVRDTLSFPSSSSRTVIPVNQEPSSGAPGLSPLLDDQSGLFVKDYGGATGLKTISQRGMSSEHTLVLLNGVRLNAFEDGLVDLGTIPLDAASTIEIQNGGQSAEYGADAVAGTVNILTSTPPAYANGEASASLGSFGRQRFQASVDDIGSDRSFVEAGIGREIASENFPFIFHNGDLSNTADRIDDDLSSEFGHLRGVLGVGNTTLAGLATAFSSDRGTPGPYTGLGLTSVARQADRDALAQVESNSVLSDRLGLQCFTQLNYAYEQYQDPGIVTNNIPLNDYYRNLDARLGSDLRVDLGNRSGLTAGFEFNRTEGEGNSLVETVYREQLGTFLSAHLGLLSDQGTLKGLTLFPAIRADMFSTSFPFYSPQLGAGAAFTAFDLGPVKNISPVLHASVGQNFRMPTFNELYYSEGGGIGNPNLKPERSVSSDAGIDVGFDCAGRHMLRLTFFDIDMTDRIVWVPAGGINVTPVNLQSTRSDGLEAGYSWTPGDLFAASANYTLNSSRQISSDFPGDPAQGKELLYLPQETANIDVASRFRVSDDIVRSLTFNADLHYIGFRFYTEDNSEFLPPFTVTNVAVDAGLFAGGIASNVKFEIQNLFNQDYQVIVSYPMPGRWYRLTFGIQY
jgi:outer membrane receptor protein involved in Fe transport